MLLDGWAHVRAPSVFAHLRARLCSPNAVRATEATHLSCVGNPVPGPLDKT